MSAWGTAISQEPGADTDSLGSGPVPSPINLGQPGGHRTPDVVASTTIQEMSLDKAIAPRDIVKPRVLDRCLPEFRSRSFEDPDRTWHGGEGAGSGCRDNPDSRVSIGYGSIGSGRRGSSSVRFDDGGEESQNTARRPGNPSAGDNRNRATDRLGIRFDEGRSSSEEKFGMRWTDSWSRSPRRDRLPGVRKHQRVTIQETRADAGFGLMKRVRARVRKMEERIG